LRDTISIGRAPAKGTTRATVGGVPWAADDGAIAYMSEAICGTSRPGCRFAHPGYGDRAMVGAIEAFESSHGSFAQAASADRRPRLGRAPCARRRVLHRDLRIPMAEAGPQGLEAFLVRPAGTKRYPLALLSHGSPRDFDDRATMSAHKYYASRSNMPGAALPR